MRFTHKSSVRKGSSSENMNSTIPLCVAFLLSTMLFVNSTPTGSTFEGMTSTRSSKDNKFEGRPCPTGYIKQDMGCELAQASIVKQAPIRRAKCFGKYKLVGGKCKCPTCKIKEKNICPGKKKLVRGVCAGPCPDGYWLIFVPQEQQNSKALTCEQPDIVDPECIAGERRLMDRCIPESSTKQVKQPIITRNQDSEL